MLADIPTAEVDDSPPAAPHVTAVGISAPKGVSKRQSAVGTTEVP